MQPAEFRRLLYTELAKSFTEMPRIKAFTTNPAVIGLHAEEAIRRFIERSVAPVRASTGAVIHESLCKDPSTVPQIDTILWSPNPSPAVFENGAFALVPKQCVFGVLEVKRSCYTEAAAKLCEVVSRAEQLSSDGVRLLDQNRQAVYPGFGVICVLEEKQTISRELQTLINEQKAAVLCRMNGVDVEPDIDGVISFVNYLAVVRHWATRVAGTTYVTHEDQPAGITWGSPQPQVVVDQGSIAASGFTDFTIAGPLGPDSGPGDQDTQR